jgi:RNA polymerase sigma-70 factor (ECF subfamily)
MLIKHKDRFEPHGKGAILAYLRTIILNRIRDAARRTKTRGVPDDIDDHEIASSADSPYDQFVARTTRAHYEAALAQLADDQREGIVLRVELNLQWDEIAHELGKNSPDAARVFVSRALIRLAEEMNRAGEA